MPPSPRSSPRSFAFLRGTVERVTFHTEETGYCVLKVKPERGGELMTVLGRTPRVVPGELIEASGEWVQNADFGRQLKAALVVPLARRPVGVGIGPHFTGHLQTGLGDQRPGNRSAQQINALVLRLPL